MKIGDVIRKYRKELNLTQEEMANRLGVTAPAVNKWEHGSTMPDITLLAPIARLLNVSLDELLSFRSDLTPAEVRHYVQSAEAELTPETYSDVLLRCRELICSYPNCDMLVHNLVTLLDHYSQINKLPEDPERDKLLAAWYEQGTESSNKEIADASADALFKFYVRRRRPDKAQKYLSCRSDRDLSALLKQARLYEEAGNQQLSLQSYEQFLLDSYEALRGVFVHLTRVKLMEDDPDGAAYYAEKRRALTRLFECEDLREKIADLDMVSYRQDQDETLSAVLGLSEYLSHDTVYIRPTLYAHIAPNFLTEDGSRFSNLSEMDTFMSTLSDNKLFSYMKGNPDWENLLSIWEQPDSEE